MYGYQFGPLENFSGANDVISMPFAYVSVFGVISLYKIVLCYGLLSLLFVMVIGLSGVQFGL